MKNPAQVRAFSLPAFALCAVLLAGCSREKPSGIDPLGDSTSPVARQTPQHPALAAANESLKAGALDEAAARLLQMRASVPEFSPKDAAEYRRALDETYTRALEAAANGDARAQAALKMIRASSPQ